VMVRKSEGCPNNLGFTADMANNSVLACDGYPHPPGAELESVGGINPRHRVRVQTARLAHHSPTVRAGLGQEQGHRVADQLLAAGHRVDQVLWMLGLIDEHDCSIWNSRPAAAPRRPAKTQLTARHNRRSEPVCCRC
jgi:hypothetical protein